MNIIKEQIGEVLNIALEGRLDTTTAPQLEQELKNYFDSIKVLNIDFKSLEYISSAGLRVLLSAQKTMNSRGKMVVKNVSKEIMEVFEMTGFADFLTIE